MQINSVISEAVSSISALDRKCRLLSEKLAPLKKLNLLESGSEEILEEKLIMPVEKPELDCLVAGVDSGFVGKDLLALDLVVIIAVGAVFSYSKVRERKSQESKHEISLEKASIDFESSLEASDKDTEALL